MCSVRCVICRYKLSSIRMLKVHYITKHTKIQITRELLKSCALNSTPNLIVKQNRRNNDANYKTIYFHDSVQITYDNDSIIIEDESKNNLIDVTFDEGENGTFTRTQGILNATISLTEAAFSRRKPRKSKTPKKLFQIGIQKISGVPKSLHEHTGEFYECHCMEKSLSKKSSLENEPNPNGSKSFCCSSYENSEEHQQTQELYCRICNQILNIETYKEHVEQHVLRIYACHLCGFEFISKDYLLGHLDYHFELQMLENVLEMEQDYNMYNFCNTNYLSGDYNSHINNIKFYLSYPYDNQYCRNILRRVVCNICNQDFYICDFEKHLKIAHFLNQ